MTPKWYHHSPTNVSSHPDPTGDRRTVLPDRRDAGTPPAPVPPKPYSVDEMLTQLRAPDGQKRRRRSAQPVYTSRRRRRLITVLVLGTAALVLGCWYGFRFFQRIRLEGETFREGVNRRISEAVGCKVEFTRIYDGGDSSLSAVEGRFSTKHDELLAAGAFSGINATLTPSSWVSSEWGITQLNITRGTLTFNPQRTVTTADTMNVVPPSVRREKAGGVRLSIDSEPAIITLDKIRFTGGLDLEWPSPDGDRKPEAIRGMKGHVRPNGADELSGAFAGGTLSLRHLHEMQLEQVQWSMKGRRLEISGARLLIGSADARAEVTGHADLARDGGVDLKVSIHDTLLKLLLPPAWHERVAGRLSAENATFTATFDKTGERRFEGDFVITGCVLRGVPFVNKLAVSLQRPDLSLLEFPQLTGHFVWSPSAGLEITNLSGDKDGDLRLAGSVKVTAAGVLSGRLKASASETALSTRSRDLPHPFGPVTDGWAAVEFGVSGTGPVINDDLTISGTPSAAPLPQEPEPGSPATAPTKEELERQFNELLPE